MCPSNNEKNTNTDCVDTTDADEPKYPPLNSLYFYLAEGCNLLCRHCWLAPIQRSPEEPGPVLDPELFYSIMEQANTLGLKRFKLTGGEPLLHPNFLEFIDYARENKISIMVETNGTLVTPEIAKKIATVENPFVSVSLDGVDAKTHEDVRKVPGSFDKAVQGIKYLVAEGVRPQIIMCVIRNNRDQMEPMVRLAEKLGSESVKFNIIQPVARGEKLHEQGETLSMEELVETGKWVERELVPSTSIRVMYHHPPAFVPLHRLHDDKRPWGRCGIMGILGVLGNGDFALCGIGQTVPELIFGNARKDKLEDVWKNSPILKEIREGMPYKFEGICGECLMRDRCLGSCLAQNYYDSRNLWAPFWFCRVAEESGLFPESRRRTVAREDA